MLRNYRRAMLIAFVVVSVLLLPAVCRLDSRNQNRTAETGVRVLSEEVGLNGRYTVRYQYIVDGRRYEATTTTSRSYDPGQPAKVCYNPADPQDEVFVYLDGPCGESMFP